MTVMRNNWLRLLIAVPIIAGIITGILYRDQLQPELLEQWVARAGIAGPILFIAVYAVSALLFLPGSVLTLAGGALFGPWLGTLYNLTGATLGATLAFLAARHMAGDWVRSKSGNRLLRLQAGVETEGWRFIAFVRLVPLFPFNLLNYALGLTRIRLLHYVLASWIFMLPGALAYTYLGYAGREAITGGDGYIGKVLLAIALLAAIIYLPRLARRLRSTHEISTYSNETRETR
jgi:uncharacterized membrane protein YdjX (TVP38/TMEM64 family)